MKKNIKYFAIALILLCCLMGAASATEDVSADVLDVDASADAVTVDAVSDEIDDSLESVVVEDEQVVDESAPAQDEIDDVKLEASVDESAPTVDENVDESSIQSKIIPEKDVLAASSEENVLGDQIVIDITNYYGMLDWYLSDYISSHQNEELFNFLLPDGEYMIMGAASNPGNNIIITGVNKENAIISGDATQTNNMASANLTTFVNITFKNSKIDFNDKSYKFINCDFINCAFIFANGRPETKTVLTIDGQTIVLPSDVFEYSFENCDFTNSIVSTNFFTIAKTAKLNVINCTFNNIEVESIVLSNANHTDNYSCQAGINIDNATFVDSSFLGVVKTQSELVGNVAVENCDNFDVVSSAVDGDYTYLNATKVKVIPVDSAVDISSIEKGVVVIALTDNSSAPIAGATFKYTVNGGEEQTDVTGEDGKFTITGLTGEVTIAVSYEGNESFNPISDSKFFNFTEETATNDTNDTPVTPTKVATKLAASKVTATYNVAKKLVITLTDKNGKKLANKKVTVKVGTISKTLKTNAKGQVSLNIASLVPKTYTATVKFAGDSSYSASTVKPKVVVKKAKVKLAAKAKTFKVKVKTKKYIVTLKNNKGKVMKKVKLTLKVGKKTYKATTNAKGKATFKITKLTKKGKYTATVKFAGNKYFKALSKKVKITVKK